MRPSSSFFEFLSKTKKALFIQSIKKIKEIPTFTEG